MTLERADCDAVHEIWIIETHVVNAGLNTRVFVTMESGQRAEQHQLVLRYLDTDRDFAEFATTLDIRSRGAWEDGVVTEWSCNDDPAISVWLNEP